MDITGFFDKPKDFTLLFRASKDGFNQGALAKKWNNKGDTLMLVKSNLGHVFGGYTNIPWTTPTPEEKFKYMKKDGATFTFSLRGDKPYKF